MARIKGQASFIKWIPLLLDALRDLGGSAESREASNWIANAVNLPPEELEKRNKHNILRFENQVHWARQYLVWEGLIDSSRRGIWTLTPEGAKSHLTEEQSRKLVQRWVKIHSERKRAREKTEAVLSPTLEAEDKTVVEAESELPENTEENELLLVLQSLSSDGFERLCKRLLHEY